MQSKLYQKLNNLFWYTILLFSCIINSQQIKKEIVKVIEIGAYPMKNKESIHSILSYIIVNDTVYSGSVLEVNKTFNQNYIKISEKHKDMFLNSLCTKWENNKYVHSTKFRLLNKINTNNIEFIWRCFEVEMEYIILPIEEVRQDFFCFFYYKNKQMVGFKDKKIKKIKRLNDLPIVFINALNENEICD